MDLKTKVIVITQAIRQRRQILLMFDRSLNNLEEAINIRNNIENATYYQTFDRQEEMEYDIEEADQLIDTCLNTVNANIRMLEEFKVSQLTNTILS